MLKCCCVYYIKTSEDPTHQGRRAWISTLCCCISPVPAAGNRKSCWLRRQRPDRAAVQGGRRKETGGSGSELRNSFYIRLKEEAGSAALQEIRQVAAKLTCKPQMCGETSSKTCQIVLDKLVSPSLAPLKVEIRTNGPIRVHLGLKPLAQSPQPGYPVSARCSRQPRARASKAPDGAQYRAP